jgi:superfamily II DNA or RNA helicase/HKD family nuclease
MFQTGLYESLITTLIQKKILEHDGEFYIGKKEIEPAEVALRLSQFLSRVLFIALGSVDDTEDKIGKQFQLSNDLIRWLQQYLHDVDLGDNILETEGRLLTAILSLKDPVAANLSEYVQKITPQSGLTQSELFIGSNAGISLESEFKKEILSADEICWLVSFIKWNGIRIFSRELEEFTRNGRKIRIITTTYMGATDPKAIDYLANLPNTEIKISYDTSNDRLHAKSYLFNRITDFNTAYIGSSNISRPAFTNGLEWNIKVTSQEIPHIIRKFQSTFDTYWAAPNFDLYDGTNPEHRARLNEEIGRARGRSIDTGRIVYYDLEPHQFQKVILDRLEAEREVHHRWKNLVVAATGTGKTIISAFDFRRFIQLKPDARLLYVAHREEILRQARQTFRDVLRNGEFGDLWVGDSKPKKYDRLFVSVQTLNLQLPDLHLTENYYDFIIVDEVHHIAAESYRQIINFFAPQILLGLTATPERQDGADILTDFCGTIAAELRLPDAINQQFLCPFQYFGLDDTVDLSNVQWERGHYVPAELTKLYTSNDHRTFHIIRNLQDIVVDITRFKALGFCVSQEHARYMAFKFNEKNISSAVLTSENSEERQKLRNDLVNGKINILFVVDIFNEGVDIPEIDTVLFLRPTESLTIFLQQLGRGLRKLPGKEFLTVLDFVGNARREYDFTQKFRALTGKSHVSIDEEVLNDFPHLPLGCSIILEERAKEIILSNIKNAVYNRSGITLLLRQYREHSSLPLTLKNFLHINPTVSLEDIYKPKINGGGGWNRLCLLAEVKNCQIDLRIEKVISRIIRNRILQCTSRSYLQFIKRMLNADFKWSKTDSIENQFAIMLFSDLWQETGANVGFKSIEEAFGAVAKDPILVEELSDVVEIVMDRLDFIERPMDIGEPCVLMLHARYTRDEILAAFGELSFDRRPPSQSGLVELKDRNLEVLFVTLQKTVKHFSPTTLYQDYALSPTKFHWQSQNIASDERGRGLSYVRQRERTCPISC